MIVYKSHATEKRHNENTQVG